MRIEWSHLTKPYELTEEEPLYVHRQSKGLSDFSASVQKGITVVLGPPASGKSVLLRLTAMKTIPDDGRITYCNETHKYVWSKASIHKLHHVDFQQVKDSLQYLPSIMHFQYHMTVEEDLLQLAQIHRIPSPRQKISVLLTKWGLSAYRKTEITELPMGLLKRYMLAQSLFSSPRIWILDEPTEGLDEVGTRILFQELIHASNNRIVLIATKDMQLAECADNLLLLERGACRRLGRKKFLTAGVPEGTVAAWYKAMQAFSEVSARKVHKKSIP